MTNDTNQFKNQHPLTEIKDHPTDPNDKLLNNWGLASMVTDAIQDLGIHSPAADLARKALGDTAEVFKLLLKVEAGDEAFIRVFQAQFALSADEILRKELGLD